MRELPLKRLDELVERELERGTFPGAVILARSEEGTIAHRAYGLRSEVPLEEEMEKRTVFDLASLTKVVATTTLSLKLVEEGIWKLGDPVGLYLERFQNDEITLLHLLTHTSGLTPWIDLFSGIETEEAALDKLFTDRWPVLEPVVPPGERVIYSDLNFMVLGLAIERAAGKGLGDLAEEQVFGPLEMEDTCFNPGDDLKDRIAPTERARLGGRVIRGEVHDENCRSLGGVSGHAGLFSTAEDLGKFVALLLNDGELGGKRILSPRTVGLMNEDLTAGLNERRGPGWKLQGEGAESAGDLLSEAAFGHTGFTGGSIWIDPEAGVGTVILTNRIHPERKRGSDEIGDFRARTNNLIVGELA